MSYTETADDSPESQKNRGAFSPILEESETSVSRVFSPGRSPTVKTSHPVTSTPIKGRSNIALLGPSLEPGPPLIPEIFLQLGRDVKKAKLEAPPTIASLRVMFMDRFQYSPGIEDFPAIYIRDPQSGVQYQLEDMSEVKDRVVLSLNIDGMSSSSVYFWLHLVLSCKVTELLMVVISIGSGEVPHRHGPIRLGS